MSNKQCHEIYADEIVGIMLGYPISKLTFASSVQAEADGKVSKIHVATITMSTQALVKALNFALDHVNENQASLMDSASESLERMSKVLKQKTDQKAEKKKVAVRKTPSRAKG